MYMCIYILNHLYCVILKEKWENLRFGATEVMKKWTSENRSENSVVWKLVKPKWKSVTLKNSTCCGLGQRWPFAAICGVNQMEDFGLFVNLPFQLIINIFNTNKQKTWATHCQRAQQNIWTARVLVYSAFERGHRTSEKVLLAENTKTSMKNLALLSTCRNRLTQTLASVLSLIPTPSLKQACDWIFKLHLDLFHL